MITPHEVSIAEHVIDRSGIVEILLAGRKRSNRGRKTDPEPYRLFLIGGLLNVMERGNFVIEDVHQTLTTRISLSDQFRLRVRRWVPTTHGEDRLEILSVHDLYNVTKTLNHALSYGPGSAPDLDDTERERRHGVIQDFADALMDVFDLGFDNTTYAIDATGIWSWGKGSFPRTIDGHNETGETDETAADESSAA